MTRTRRQPYVSSFLDRPGKRRWRWRKSGHASYYFRNPADTAGFALELAALQPGRGAQPLDRAPPRQPGAALHMRQMRLMHPGARQLLALWRQAAPPVWAQLLAVARAITAAGAEKI